MHESMASCLHPSVLAVICQIQAIKQHITRPGGDITLTECSIIRDVLAAATSEVDARVGWLATFDPDHGRAA